MRTGFLGSQTPVSTPPAGKEAPNHASIGADKPMEPPPHGDGSGSPAKSALTPAQMTAGLEECLDLLRGPTDERRFVGLLLVTKLLPAGDNETIKRVYEAVGPAFLSRLLLPLRTTQPPSSLAPTDAAAAATQQQQQQQDAAQCGLALAVLSRCARVPELAGAEEVLEKLPLLLNVVRAGGITPLLAARLAQPAATASSTGPGSTPHPAARCDPAADAAAVQDALECAVAAACSGAEGRVVAAECGAAAAAAAVLQDSPPGGTQAMSLALQLLAAVVGGEGPEGALAGGQGDLRVLLPALSRAFALPAEQLTASKQSSINSSSSSKEEAQRLQADQLRVQLEALHVLLLLLPLPLPVAASLPKQLLGPAALWPGQLRRGLALLLRGRISAVQRHSALQLATAVLEILGPEWLLGGEAAAGGSAGGGGGGGGAPAAAADAAEVGAFFQVLVEVTKVETSVLLHDALAPAVPIPLASAPGTAAGDWRAPPLRPRTTGAGTADDEDSYSHAGSDSDAGGSSSSLPDAAGAELAAELSNGGGGGGGGQQGESELSADVAPLVRVLHSEVDRRQLEQEMRMEGEEARAAGEGAAGQQQGQYVQRVSDTAIPTDMRWDGPSEVSGARADRLLPCCFALLEAAVEALALDTQRAEQAEDWAAAASGRSEAPPPAPVLSDAVAQRALFSLQEAVEVVLQFIEQVSCEEAQGVAGDGGVDAHAAHHQPPLMLASLRVLARFCAEVPEVFGERLRPLLPSLLALRSGPAGAGWHLELLEEGERPPPAPAEGTTFLLPLLLQVSDPAYAQDGGERQAAEQRLWLDALSQPNVLPLLVQYACHCVAASTPAVTLAAVAQADDALIYAVRLLLHLVTPPSAAASAAPAADDPAAAARQLRARRRQLLLADGTLQLLHELLRVAKLRPAVPPVNCKPHELLDTARVLITVAALAAALTASIAEELQAGGGSAACGSLDEQLRMKRLLQLSQQQQQALQARDDAEEEQDRRWRRHKGMPEAAPQPSLPSLGPITGRQLAALCSQLLSAMQVGLQLTCSAPHVRLLMPKAAAAGAEADPVMARLAAARSAVAADAALQQELSDSLAALAGQATELLRGYPPFRELSRACPWVKAEAAISRRQEAIGTASSESSEGVADTPPVAEDLPALVLFVSTVGA